MNKIVVALLLLWGGFYYMEHYYKFETTMEYIKKHPEKKWAAPAQYWVGMAYYQRSDYEKAKEAFGALLEQHPTDYYYVEKAIIPYDDAAQYTFDWGTSKFLLQKYIDEFPEGKKIDLARKRLDMVKYSHP